MPWSHSTGDTFPIVVAQQPAGDNAAYEGGRKVGQVFGIIFLVVIVLWVLGKMFGRR